jgi:hypothetical protein
VAPVGAREHGRDLTRARARDALWAPVPHGYQCLAPAPATRARGATSG